MVCPIGAETTTGDRGPGKLVVSHAATITMTAATSASRLDPTVITAPFPPRGEPRNAKPAKRVSRSAGFATCSPRGMGDPHEDASGINASEGLQYAPGAAARKTRRLVFVRIELLLTRHHDDQRRERVQHC